MNPSDTFDAIFAAVLAIFPAAREEDVYDLAIEDLDINDAPAIAARLMAEAK